MSEFIARHNREQSRPVPSYPAGRDQPGPVWAGWLWGRRSPRSPPPSYSISLVSFINVFKFFFFLEIICRSYLSCRPAPPASAEVTTLESWTEGALAAGDDLTLMTCNQRQPAWSPPLPLAPDNAPAGPGRRDLVPSA